MGSVDTLSGAAAASAGNTLLSPQDIYLLKEGTHSRLYDKLGCHLVSEAGVAGGRFAVWAPNAQGVCVFGDFNDWDKASHPLTPRSDDSGVWEGFVPRLEPGTRYKYRIESRYNGYQVDKSDPYAFYCELPPQTYDGFMTAPSMGQFFKENIRAHSDRYGCATQPR